MLQPCSCNCSAGVLYYFIAEAQGSSKVRHVHILHVIFLLQMASSQIEGVFTNAIKNLWCRPQGAGKGKQGWDLSVAPCTFGRPGRCTFGFVALVALRASLPERR